MATAAKQPVPGNAIPAEMTIAAIANPLPSGAPSALVDFHDRQHAQEQTDGKPQKRKDERENIEVFAGWVIGAHPTSVSAGCEDARELRKFNVRQNQTGKFEGRCWVSNRRFCLEGRIQTTFDVCPWGADRHHRDSNLLAFDIHPRSNRRRR
jgi:hypothetical protein